MFDTKKDFEVAIIDIIGEIYDLKNFQCIYATKKIG